MARPPSRRPVAAPPAAPSVFAREGWLGPMVLVAGLGYFVDLFDLFLFGTLRIPSLVALGVPQDQLLAVGLHITNAQLGGMVLGGFIWGLIGDKKGRVHAMFGSILVYSLASLANAYVTSVEQYALLRFLGGMGLAGELGAAITLVAETLSIRNRGYATGVLGGMGMLGIIAATLLGHFADWQTCYIVGGVMGLALLVLRMKILESRMFTRTLARGVRRGSLVMLLRPRRLILYVAGVLIGLPILFTMWFYGVFAPEIGRGLGLSGPLEAPIVLGLLGAGQAVGDTASGFLCQYFRSRRKVLLGMLLGQGACIVLLLNLPAGTSPNVAYAVYALMGLVAGYWALANTMAAEQFGTNLRATVAITTPNLIRVPLIGATMLAGAVTKTHDAVTAAWDISLTLLALSLVSLLVVKETFGKDLDHLER